MTALILLLSLAATCRAQGESVAVPDMAAALRANESFLRQHEGALERAGILDAKAGLDGETAQLDSMAKAAADGKPMPGAPQDERLGFGGAGRGALGQLRSSPGARGGPVSDVRGGPLGEKSADQLMAERIERIVEQKVHAAVAKRAYENLLWTAYKGNIAGAPTPEVHGLLEFLRGQLSEKQDGAQLWTLHFEGDMPSNILATYDGTIAVGPSFAAMAEGGVSQMTVLFHEMLHGFDDGKDGTPIEVNRMSSLYHYDPHDPNPALHNASEMLAYTDMAKWASAF